MKKTYSLTFPQQSIYLTEQFYKNTNVNNICGTAIVEEKLDFDLLKKAINIVIQYNDSFRIHLIKEGTDVKQLVSEYQNVDIEITNLDNRDEISTLENTAMQKQFDLFGEDNLFEFKIFKFPDQTGGFLLNIHHIISDAWTLGLTCRKIMQEYSNFINNSNELETNLSYLNYIEDEQKYINSDKFKKDKDYWEKLFRNLPDSAKLPSDLPSSDSNLSCVGERSLFTIPKSKMKQITNFCNENKISTFNFLMAIYSIYISKITHLSDFAIGTPILNRSGFSAKNTTGMFVNNIPFRINLKNNTTFKSLVQSIAESSLALLRHQKYPYKLLLEELRKNDPSIPSLYDIVLSYQVTKANQVGDYNYSTRWAFNGTSPDSLTIQFFDLDEAGVLNVAYDYKKLQYSNSYIKAMHSRIMEIINKILETPNLSLDSISVITKNEQELLLNKFNKTDLKYNKKSNVISEFTKQAKLNPNKTAIIFENQEITYKELNEKSNILAHYLLSNGYNANTIIGIMLNRSIELAIGLLAILKIGATYLPIDPSYPKDRITYMLEDSQAKLVLVKGNQKKIDAKTIDISLESDLYKSNNTTDLKIDINPEDLIYLIYTSGSTGKPKGVMLKHKNITNFLLGTKQVIDFAKEKIMTSVTTICFDIFVLEFWGALTSGMTLLLANELEQNDGKALNELCLKHNASMIQTTPSRFANFIKDSENTQFLKNMSDILVGGEGISKALLDKLSATTKATIFNMYGPTETAVWSTIKRLSGSKEITIGKPIANTKCYILDKDKNLLPPYIAGELYIGGDGVSNGYLHREELTKEKFIPSPFDKNYLIYNTNDLAYFTDSGEIVHLGRTDFQVKIRGYRIELGEIENKVISIPEISNVAVIADDNQKYLICYYTTSSEISQTAISDYLMKELPNYMVPSYFCKLDSFPLTPNGKLDRKKLPKVKLEPEKIQKYRTKTEKLLYTIIADILKNDELDINTPFITLGLDSLGIISVQTKLLQYNYVLNTQDFYKFNTIKLLAENIDNNIYTYKEKDAQVPVQFRHSFDEILSKIKYKTLSDEILGNVFLTGANGSIGIHILHELLTTTNVNIYCLVRGNSIAHSTQRLLEKYEFYFKEDISNLLNNRVIVLNGNISKENLSLANSYISILKQNVTTFIHTAAIVKHYGNFEQFKNVNIEGTRNVASLAFELQKRLIHISSISVSGNYLVKQDNRNIEFSENNLYIGQKYTDNVYVHSKFEAEKIVLSFMEKGLNAQIHRVGILSGRLSDGVFQENISDNAFYSRIKSMITLGIVSDTMLNQQIEFTPIDVCTKSIVALAKNNIMDNKIYHLFNHNFVAIRDIIQVLNNFGYNIDIVSEEEFQNRIINFSKSDKSKLLLGIINDLDYKNNSAISINYNFTVKILSNYTQKYLHLLKCDWNITNKSYIKKIITYMKDVNFI